MADIDTSFLTPDQVNTLVNNGSLSKEAGSAIIANNGSTTGFPDAVVAAKDAGITPVSNQSPTPPTANTTGVPAAALAGLSDEQRGALTSNGMQVPDTNGNHLESTVPVANDASGKPQSQTQREATDAAAKKELAAQTPATGSNTGAPPPVQTPLPTVKPVGTGVGTGLNAGETGYLGAVDTFKTNEDQSLTAAQKAQQSIGYKVAANADITAKTIRDGNLQDELAQHADEAANTIAKNDTKRRIQAREDELNNIKDVDPGHFWKKAGTPMTILAIVSEALGSLGQGILSAAGKNPGENQAVKLINGAIDRDMESQQANINKQFKVLSAHMQIDDNQENRDRYEHGQRLEAMAMGKKRVQNEVAALAATLTSETAKDNATILISQLQHDIDKDDLEAGRLRFSILSEAGQRHAREAAAAQKPMQDEVKAFREVNAERIKTNKPTIGFEEFHQSWMGQGGIGGPNPSNNGLDQKGDETDEQRRNRTTNIGGKPVSFVNKETADKAAEWYEAHEEATKLYANLKKDWDDGNVQAYQTDRQALIELGPKLMGFTRGPSSAQAGESGGDDEKARGTIGGMIPVYGHWYGGSAAGALSTIPVVGGIVNQKRTTEGIGAFGNFLDINSTAANNHFGLNQQPTTTNTGVPGAKPVN